MHGKPKKSGKDRDLTRAYLTGAFDEDRVDAEQRFGQRSKHHQKNKTVRTQQQRSDEELSKLPAGEVIQVHSLFSDVLGDDGVMYRCVQRKTLAKVSETQIVVGDRVRFTVSPELNDKAKNEAVMEAIEPRKTLLVRADSFKAIEVHPIVANAEQMLIVAALHLPEVKWGLIDRMVIAARSGGLDPIVCLNKIDTATDEDDLRQADEVLAHYATLGIRTLKTGAISMTGIDELRAILKDKLTVLAGHSGVGKSSLVRAVEPSIDLRVGDISRIHNKGMHTTTSARKYPLGFGSHVIDTPGVKLFGIWHVDKESLLALFPDVEADTAPDWREDSYQRILESLPEKIEEET